jgi:hypothetical protein
MTVRDSITRTGARTPGAEDYPTSKAAHNRVLNPTQCGITEVHYDVRERRTQTKHKPVYAGSRLKPANAWEGAALHASLPAVSGKTRRTE